MERSERVSRSPFLPGAPFAAEVRELGVKSDRPGQPGQPGQRKSTILCPFVTLSAHASTQTDRMQCQSPAFCSLHDGGSGT